MKRGFTLIELMILVLVIGVLAMAVYPSYNSIQARAMEAKAMANMQTAQLAVEQFATMTDGIYPQAFNTQVQQANPLIKGNFSTVAGVAGPALVPVPSAVGAEVLLPGNMRNPVARINACFASMAGAIATPPSAAPAICAASGNVASAPGSIFYFSADYIGAAASINNARKYIIYGYGVYSAITSPLQGKQ